MTVTKKCEHNRTEFFRAERDTGNSAYFQCLDCDKITYEWTDEADADYEAGEIFNVRRWQEPVWDDEELHSCDICGGEFTEEEMATLGGDRSVDGLGLMAFPAECVGCREESGR